MPFKTALRKRAKTLCPVLRCLILSCGVFSYVCLVLYFSCLEFVLSCVIFSAFVLVLVLVLSMLVYLDLGPTLVSLFWDFVFGCCLFCLQCVKTQKKDKANVISCLVLILVIVFVFLSFLSCKITYLVLPYGLLMPAPARHKQKRQH